MWKATLGMALTGTTHLAQVHWVVANAAHIGCREKLGQDHPIRKVLKVFLFNTGAVNYASTSKLFPKDSFLQRVSSLTNEGLVNLIQDSVCSFKYETYPDFIAAKSLGPALCHLPLVADALPVWEAFHAFFKGYVDVFYADDAAVAADSELGEYWACVETRGDPESPLKYGLPALTRAALVDHLAHHAFTVTAWHELVGGLVPYVTTPTGMPAKVRPGTEVMDVQTFVHGLCIAGLTGLRQPQLLGDWTHLMPERPAAARHLHGVLMKTLQGISAEIDARNASAPCATRRRRVDSFNPRTFECSVSA